MKIELHGRDIEFDEGESIDISIPLHFNGSQPNAYGVERASSKACEYGDLVGDTRHGGSCNFEQLTLIPHCNGTHTECVGHLTNERISVTDCLQQAFIPAILLSIEPESIDDGDLVISANSMRGRIDPPAYAGGSALIVRTLPNDDSKMTREYGEQRLPPYFAPDGMEYIVECGFKHLLVDLPSIDRLYDEGKLINHRIFWNVEPDSFQKSDRTRRNSTITELIYVPNDVIDGEYLLNLQIAPFDSDASPSRPVMFKVK